MRRRLNLNYRLLFRSSDDRSAPAICFEGSDPGQALLLAQRHECPAELWGDGKYLCTLRRAPSGFWTIYQNLSATAGAEPLAAAAAATAGSAARAASAFPQLERHESTDLSGDATPLSTGRR
jgi:hypothetical protein